MTGIPITIFINCLHGHECLVDYNIYHTAGDLLYEQTLILNVIKVLHNGISLFSSGSKHCIIHINFFSM